MIRLLTALLLLTISAQSYSQSCLGKLYAQKKSSYVARIHEDAKNVLGFVSSVGGLGVGIAIAGTTFPGFLIAAGVSTAPILAGEAIREVHNRPINRMIKLITQSIELMEKPDSKPGKLLSKTAKYIQRRGGDISVHELALSILEASKNPENCQFISRVRDINDNIENGSIRIVHLEEKN